MIDRRIFATSRAGYTAFHRFLLDGSPYGGLLGPVADLSNFMKAYLNGGTFKGSRLLERSSIVEMQTAQRDLHGKELVTGRPMPQRIGLGWHLNGNGETRHCYHFGGGGGFWCELRVYPGLD